MIVANSIIENAHKPGVSERLVENWIRKIVFLEEGIGLPTSAQLCQVLKIVSFMFQHDFCILLQLVVVLLVDLTSSLYKSTNFNSKFL